MEALCKRKLFDEKLIKANCDDVRQMKNVWETFGNLMEKFSLMFWEHSGVKDNRKNQKKLEIYRWKLWNETNLRFPGEIHEKIGKNINDLDFLLCFSYKKV